jgi:glycosyltransferase involved in cell wall biosynthesis
MRAGVNALYLIPGGVGGTEIYLRSLLTALSVNPRGHEYIVFLNRETGNDLVPQHKAFRAVQTGVKATFRPARIVYEQSLLIQACRRERVDALYNPGFTSPILSSIPNVTLIHDLQHYHHPEHFKKADWLAWHALVWASCRFSRRLLAVSDATREDIHKVYRVPLDRIHLASPGVDAAFFNVDRTRTEPIILCVSTLHPHKNIDRLVDAYALVRQSHPEYRLILAGMRGFHGDAVEARIQRLGLTSHVQLTGWIPRDQIRELYRRARIAVFPSTFEGFGIPVVEAMAAGVPLIISGIRPMTDIAAGTALTFPPHDTGALAGAIERLITSEDLAVDHAQRAKLRAANYNWLNTANATLDALEQAGAT